MSDQLEWRVLATGKAHAVSYEADGDSGRILFTLPEGLEMGQLELNGLPVTGYFLPDDPDFIWSLRPYLIVATTAPEVAPEPEA